MEFIKIRKLANYFNITENECYKLLLNYGNNNEVKILHEINETLIMPKRLYNDIIDTKESIYNSLTDYNTIKSQAKETIPFELNGYVYYLFLNNSLVYIGQSTNIALRISTHVSDRKIFNQVYTEVVDKRILLLKEKFYIHRDCQELNISVMDNREYLKEILNLTTINI